MMDDLVNIIRLRNMAPKRRAAENGARPLPPLNGWYPSCPPTGNSSLLIQHHRGAGERQRRKWPAGQ
jgi:hypothetical protein